MPLAAYALADYIVSSRWDDLPDRVKVESLRTLVNWVGCAVGGSDTPAADAALRGFASLNRPARAAVLGRNQRLDPLDAVVVNCISSSAHTFDDTHLKTITHPTGPVAAALLAHAETEIFRGDDFLLALMVGMEVECRLATVIGKPASGSHKGWYMTGLVGGVGAAAAVSRLMGLDREKTLNALGLAATQAGGFRATHGSMAIAFVPAIAGQQGLLSTRLAAAGFSCSDHAIEGKNGLLDVVAPGADIAALTKDLGSYFEVLNNTYKPYPCGIVIHPSIDAALRLFQVDGVRVADIGSVELQVHPDAMALCWRLLPETELDAQVSLFHWVAVALVTGAAGIEQGELRWVLDAAVRSLQPLINVVVSTELGSDQAIVVVQKKGGQRVESITVHATGSVETPLTDAALDAKFRTLCRRTLRDEATESLLRICRQADALVDISAISRGGTA